MLGRLVFLALCLVLTNAARQRYDNHRVYRVHTETRTQLEVLQSLDGTLRDVLFLDGVHCTKCAIDVIVAPTQNRLFLQILKDNQFIYELLDGNAQSRLEEEEREDVKPLRSPSDYNWEQYYELNDTYAWLVSLSERYPHQVSIIEAGTSYENRSILGVKISYKTGNRAIFIESGIHAREWITAATVTYITNQLLTSTDRKVRYIAENFDWYIIPHANPDGYVYTHTTNRLWRKTRSPHGNCFGVDPNRNWGFHWNEVGTSSNPCSDTFSGPAVFSEIEVKSLAEYIAARKDNIMLYISYHSYSQLLLFPYGHTSELPKNYLQLKRIFDISVDAIAQRYGTKYTGGNIYDAIYPASGASIDWVYGALGVNLTYCYELRPSSSQFWYGFQLPASQIKPTGEETLDSLVAMVKAAAVER